MLMTVDQLIEDNGVYAYLFVGGQFFATSVQDIVNRFVNSTTKVAHLALNRDLFRKYVIDVPGGVSDYHVAKVLETAGFGRLRNPTIGISIEGEQREAM